MASVSSLEKSLGVVGKNNIEVATKIGKEIASRALKKGLRKWYLIGEDSYIMEKLRR